MLLNHLSKYLESVEKAIRKLEGAYVERYEEEVLTVNRVNLSQIMHIGYRYHFQDAKNSVIFRYDNTPHFPELDTYPHHKHISERVVAAAQPTIFAVIEEAMLSQQTQ